MSHSIIAATSLLIARALERVCPKCGKKQRAKMGESRRTILCSSCRTPIPPPNRGGR